MTKVTIFEDLIGKTLIDIKIVDDEQIIFIDSEYNKYKFYHSQSCCEYVRIEDICGDYKDLLNSPLLEAELVKEYGTNLDSHSSNSFTWSFYKFSTIKGNVNIRWLGESNGYYSEEVDFKKYDKLIIENYSDDLYENIKIILYFDTKYYFGNNLFKMISSFNDKTLLSFMEYYLYDYSNIDNFFVDNEIKINFDLGSGYKSIRELLRTEKINYLLIDKNKGIING